MIWCNQEQIGRPFDLYATEVGKILIAYGLKEARTGLPTNEALADGYAKFECLLQNGDPLYRWNKHKVTKLLSMSYKPIK